MAQILLGFVASGRLPRRGVKPFWNAILRRFIRSVPKYVGQGPRGQRPVPIRSDAATIRRRTDNLRGRSYNRHPVANSMNGAVLRLIDANANRAREALRVLEDYARFVLDDQPLSAALKSLRHDFTAAVGPLQENALLHRDTPGDVGTANKVPTELTRSGLTDVVTAAGKRLGEALRTIEEFAKIDYPAVAAKVEAVRYAGYDVESRLARTLRPAGKFAGVRLYVLVMESACRLPWLRVAEEAIAGGADCLQLREKTLEGGEFLARAKVLADVCRRAGVLFVVNDRPDVAVLCGADGVHVGQGDLPAAEVRKVVGRDMLVGVSTHSAEQARQAARDGADYVGIGPVFPSGTKPRDFVAGLAAARDVAAAVKIPAVAIAGITESNVDDVMSTGVQAAAVTAAVAGSENPRAAAARLKAKLER